MSDRIAEPIIEEGYAICSICYREVEPYSVVTICKCCGNLIDWSWMNEYRKGSVE